MKNYEKKTQNKTKQSPTFRKKLYVSYAQNKGNIITYTLYIVNNRLMMTNW